MALRQHFENSNKGTEEFDLFKLLMDYLKENSILVAELANIL